jgi:hypothetical protein
MFHLLQAVASNPTPFEYASNHLHLIGWPALLAIAWKVSKYFERGVTQITKTVSQIDHMATNHFPHMELSLSKQDGLLENMDRNLQRMADKL